MNGIKKNSDSTSSNSGFSKAIIVVLGVALLLTVSVLVGFVVKGDFVLKSPETTASNATGSSIVYKEPPTFATTKRADTVTEETKNNNYTYSSDIEKTTIASNVNTEAVATTSAPVNSTNVVKPEATTQALEDPSGWSKKQIISKAAEAVNKTKAYTGNLVVTHSESFNADVTECTGGTVVASVANLMIGWVVAPVNETLTYQNGTAVNSEGETVPIILPKKGGFSLNENGVDSASVNRSGNEYIIKINLVKENVGMYDVPTHNASAIGYLDVANFDISFMQVDSADIIYKGSSLELHINSDGYVTYAKYNIPLNITGAAHSGNISGSAVFDGEQTEIWQLNW